MPKNLTDDMILKERLTETEYKTLPSVHDLQTESIKNSDNPLVIAMRSSLSPLCVPLASAYDTAGATQLNIILVTPASQIPQLSQLLTLIDTSTRSRRFKLTPVLNIIKRGSWFLEPDRFPGWLNIEMRLGEDPSGVDREIPDDDDIQYLAMLWNQNVDVVAMRQTR